jgi:hypothetical protein
MWSFINSVPQGSLDYWYRWLTYLTIGLPVLGGLCGLAAFMVSSRISDLQAVALKQAQNTAVEAREFATPRRLSSEQIAKMSVVARRLCSNIKVPVTAANSNQEAQTYALDFVKIFKDAGCASDLQLPIPGLTADVQGVRVGVRNLADIPAEVGAIDKIFFAGGIWYEVNPLNPDVFPNERFVLIIGAKPPPQIPRSP